MDYCDHDDSKSENLGGGGGGGVSLAQIVVVLVQNHRKGSIIGVSLGCYQIVVVVVLFKNIKG